MDKPFNMQTFNSLPLLEKCSILYYHGKFVESHTDSQNQYAIYVLDRKYDFNYAIMLINKAKLSIEEVTVLENSDVAKFIEEAMLKGLHSSE